jgi:DNA-binding XRE family transcriptional regulator
VVYLYSFLQYMSRIKQVVIAFLFDIVDAVVYMMSMRKPCLNDGAAKLRTWLIGRKIAQDDFAAMVETSNATMVNCTSGRSVPSPELAARISSATGGAVRPLDWLAEYGGNPSKVPSFRRGRRSNSERLATSQVAGNTRK